MSEPKEIGLGEAMERLRDGLPVEADGTGDGTGWTQFRFHEGSLQWLGQATGYWNTCTDLGLWSFRIPEAPQVVKPMEFDFSEHGESLTLTRRNIKSLPDCAWVVSIVPAEQHARKIELEDALAENYCDETACALVAFLRAERGLK